MAGIALRHRWAVELLNPMPGERVLEIGCGNGLATELALAAGAEVLAVDRSEKMAEACRKRNAGAERLTVIAGVFEEMGLGDVDAAFAVNVDFPRHEDLGWARKLAEVVKPSGRIVLLLEAPAARTGEQFAGAAIAGLVSVGCRIEVLSQDGVVAVRGVRLAVAAND